MTNELIWIGPRHSDIENDSFFKNSITSYGDNNYSYCNYKKIRQGRGSKDEILFIDNSIKELSYHNPNYQYMLYDQSEIVKINQEHTPKIICTNKPSIIEMLNSKHFTRSWLSNDINCMPFIIMPFSDLKYCSICKLFPGVSTFVIQNIYGAGGTGTHLIENESDILKIKMKYNPYEVSIISPYISNSISLNVHILCGKHNCTVFPSSVQHIQKLEQRLLYSGSNFICHNNKVLRSQICSAANLIGKKLISLGYLGIAGIDFMWANNTLYFVEINPRFQGSTRILNIWLKKNNYPSIYQLNYEAFAGNECCFEFQNNIIPFISYNCILGANSEEQLPSIHANHEFYCRDLDGWNSDTKCLDNVYMYREIYQITQ